MKLSDPRLWLALVSLGLVLWLVYADLGGFDVEQASPGPLTSVHAREDLLTSRDGCTACHGGRDVSMSQACATCHVAIGEQLASNTGFHGSLGADAERCGHCHVEHHGDALPLVAQRAFTLAGFEDRADFDHPGVDFGLVGLHAPLACSECHPNADAELLPLGERRFLGLEQACAACHEDPHEGRMAQSCEACHSQSEPFVNAANFEHTAAFPLLGAHAGHACADCHTSGSAHDFEVLAGTGPRPASRACGDCHESPHTAPFIEAVAREQGMSPAATCSACPDAVTRGFEPARSQLPRELHALTGFPLVPPHEHLDCAACHDPGSPALARFHAADSVQDLDAASTNRTPPAAFADFSARFPGRSADDCAACHADPHGGQFEAGTYLASAGLGTSCLACHARTHFDPPRFDVEQHARTSFALVGAHRRTACAECHVIPLDTQGPRVFHGTPTSCADCHLDPHVGRFALQSGGSEDCGACHQPTSFADVERGAFEHGARTGFPLEGAHAAASCESCHPRSQMPDELGRTFGRVADVFQGPLDRCSTCHADVHRGAFDAPQLPRAIEGRTDCARCHAPTTFSAFDRGVFDHRVWTGFELVGNHARAACEACHVPTLEADPLGRRFGHAPGSACTDCHVDPHAGQFADRGSNGCASCHPPTSPSFRALAFDHASTRFPLLGAHARADCHECHVPSSTVSGERVVRYRPLGTRCQDCHDHRVRPEDLFDDDDDDSGRGRGGDDR